MIPHVRRPSFRRGPVRRHTHVQYRAALVVIASVGLACRAYQPVPNLAIAPETQVFVTFPAPRQWTVPSGDGGAARTATGKRLMARIVSVAGDTVIVRPTRLEDPRGRLIAFPQNAEPLRLTPADSVTISTNRFSGRYTAMPRRRDCRNLLRARGDELHRVRHGRRRQLPVLSPTFLLVECAPIPIAADAMRTAYKLRNPYCVRFRHCVLRTDCVIRIAYDPGTANCDKIAWCVLRPIRDTPYAV